MKQQYNYDSSSSAPEFRAMPIAASQPPLFEIETTRSVSFPVKRKTKKTAPINNYNKKLENLGWQTKNLTRLGALYPLSSSNRRVPMKELRAVYERLVHAFQRLSLEATFHEVPSVYANCRSLEQVDLVVNIWQSREDPEQAIVEVHRVAGDTIVYSGYMRKILTAVTQDISVNVDRTMICHESAAIKRVDALLRRLPMQAIDAAPGSLEITLHLLRSDRYDSRCLGLESLAILTDATKTGLVDATKFAKAVLVGRLEQADGAVVIDSRIQERVLYLALMGRYPDTPTESNHATLEYEKHHAHLAMQIIANAIGLLTDSFDLTAILEAAKVVTGQDMISSMQERVCNAHEAPHGAYLATRILSAFCRVQPRTVRRCVKPGTVRAAQHVGHCSHAALEMETGRLLSAMLEVA